MTLNQMYIGIFVAGLICSAIIRGEISRVLRYTVVRGERLRRNRMGSFLEKFTMSPYYDAAPLIFFLWYYVQMIMTVVWLALFFVLSHSECSQSVFDKLYRGFVIVSFGLPLLYKLIFVGVSFRCPPRWDYSKYKVRRKQ